MRKTMGIVPLVLAGLLLAGAAGPKMRRPTPADDPRTQWTGRDVAVGDLAPDFALARLDPFLKAAADDPPPKLQIEKLSSWRGKRPVLLVFSSYT